MKLILKIAFLLLYLNCNGQTMVDLNTYNQEDNSNKYFKDLNNNYQNFIGTWENTSNSSKHSNTITFRVIIWKETRKPLSNEKNSYIDDLLGSFMIIKNLGTRNEVILHNSVKYFPQSNTTSNWSLFGYAFNATVYTAYFTDTCANGGDGVLSASAKLEITNLGTSPSIAHWTVKRPLALFPGQSFTVPTDIMLTKVN